MIGRGVGLRSLGLGLLLIAAVETAALACSCIAPGTPEDSRIFAREAVRNAVAIVEVEALTEYSPGGDGELVQVDRVLWGEAPRQLRLARSGFASSASCDLLLARGQRKVLILSRAEGGRYAMQSLCSDFLVGDRGFLDVTLEEARRRDGPSSPAGERG
jgi:hypothetical protein